jgi:hypothetical protein
MRFQQQIVTQFERSGSITEKWHSRSKQILLRRSPVGNNNQLSEWDI